MAKSKRVRFQEEEPLANWPERVTGGKYVRMLEAYVQKLRSSASSHGNREMFLDDVVIAHLLAFYNPTLRSLRTFEDFSQTRQAQRHLSVRRLCRSTLSDFHRIADASLLEPIVRRLQQVADTRRTAPAGLPETLGKVLAVDGSFFALAADVAWAVRRGTNQGGKKASARLDVHLNVASGLPEIIDVSGYETSEAEHAARSIQPGAIHVYDRGIFSFDLIEAQVEAQAFFVHRLREPAARSPKFLAESPRALTREDQAAGVTSDALGRLAGSAHRKPPEMLLREVVVQSPDEPGGAIRLLTNLVEVDARIVAALYRWRWQVELFFRWLKLYANFEHLISHSRAGILLSFYVAVIGVTLMYLHTDARPSKYAFSLLGMVAGGGATLEEIAPILAERQRQIALDRASLARRRAKKQA
jgi:hypothetical protein